MKFETLKAVVVEHHIDQVDTAAACFEERRIQAEGTEEACMVSLRACMLAGNKHSWDQTLESYHTGSGFS